MYKYFFPIVFIFVWNISSAQNKVNVSIKNTTLAATDSLPPFWFGANQHGKIVGTGPFFNVSDLFVGQNHQQETNSAFSFTWGGNLVAAFGENNYYQLNQAYGGLLFRGWELKAGMFYEPTLYAGLSTSNGNLFRSHNARPYPMIRFSTPNFKSIPFLPKWIGFKAAYDEGLLNDARYVENARLHHKSFYFQIQPHSTWKIQTGFEHYAMWGGTSVNDRIGKLPSSFNAYWRYVLGASGNDEFPVTDQINKAGNQFGTYQLAIKKSFPETEAAFYLSHPFEDLSGINLRNWPDNLLGLHLCFINNQYPATDVVYEFTNTRQQSIRGDWDRQEPDNYFNHGVYNSGNTYHQMVMGSPLFFPVIKENGMVRRIRSNRFFAHHLGLKGAYGSFFWKGLLTYIHHFGLYNAPFEPSQKQVSGLFEVEYINPGFPVDLGLSVAADAGNNLTKNGGLRFWIAKSW